MKKKVYFLNIIIFINFIFISIIFILIIVITYDILSSCHIGHVKDVKILLKYKNKIYINYYI